ncbi:MAG TPA: hypothetical protein VE974_25465 [Thermoanaerobaculia bacterium]|nr:hypothetical protein [Thermoanaerobaculia bacterium]
MLAIVVYLIATGAGAQAEDAALRSYAVPDHGTLKLSVPAGWTQRVEGEPAMPPTITLSSDDGKLLLMITPLWSPEGDPKFNSPESIREAIEGAAKSIQASAVEKELPLRTLKTASGEGFFFWATDRAPGAGEHEYMANGAVPAGKLLLSFTVLSHAAPPAGIADALAVVASASQVP